MADTSVAVLGGIGGAPSTDPSVATLKLRSQKRTKEMFVSDRMRPPSQDSESKRLRYSAKIVAEYRSVKDLAPPAAGRVGGGGGKAQRRDGAGGKDGGAVQKKASSKADTKSESPEIEDLTNESGVSDMIDSLPVTGKESNQRSILKKSVLEDKTDNSKALVMARGRIGAGTGYSDIARPEFHPNWELFRVVSGHQGHVRAIAVDVSNDWFATGAADRTIKIWNLASGTLKLTLTGHISTVRGLAISERQPYLFSAAEDKMVKCWDLEQNKVVRHFHGHLSAVYCCALHPTLDILCTGGRDSTVRVWDIRSKTQIHTMGGHTNTVNSIVCQGADPQVISGSMDTTVQLYDLASGKKTVTMTNHKKGVRAVTLHPTEFTFASASADNIKKWQFPDGKFMQNCSGHDAIVNSLQINADGVMISSADNGSMKFWDYRTGYNFQSLDTIVQPGSLASEAGIFASTFDKTGSRFITCEADKTIKFYKEDSTSTPETHPINFKPSLQRKRY
eukprot:TRINITY_DN3369_c0_g1_i1.p1 TRINITY_DN3369_c0_g1~~TRINITY_DN3369_c0_g1_i1.p1  ORF type:complete len:505 (-),score=91.08 TRINITY_DN3369_c0_g1_i1:130-1644(-)